MPYEPPLSLKTLLMRARERDGRATSILIPRAARRKRGVRFDLRNNGGGEQVFLDEAQAERLLMELDLMEYAKSDPLALAPGGMRVHGTESCWMPNPVERILCPELQSAPTWSGLRLWTFGGAIFEFRDRPSTDLRALVARAVAELDQL